MKPLKVAFYLSDVGYGHMVRQKYIINSLIKKFKDIKIVVVTSSNIEIIEEIYKSKISYIKHHNSIELFKNSSGYFSKKKTKKILHIWKKNIKKNYIFFKNNFYNYDFIISDYVPEVFYFSKKLKIKCYGICHFTWSWFFSEVYKENNIIRKMRFFESLATKTFFPPFTPTKIFKNYKKNQYKDIDFITEEKKFNLNNNKKKTFLIMDSGTKTLSKKISSILSKIENQKRYLFLVGTTSLSQNDYYKIEKSKNIIPVTTLKSMYSNICKVDYVITRAGFNSLSECITLKKPTLFMNEKYNPEIEENIKFINQNNLGSIMSSKDWGENFLDRLDKFVKNESTIIKNNLNFLKFGKKGAKQVVNCILNIKNNDKNYC